MHKKLILCGRLFDGVEETLRPNAEILVIGETIAAVGSELPRTNDTEIVDLTDATVMPGLIDAHIHLENFDNDRDPDYLLFRSDEWKSLGALFCAQRALARGFTTLRVPGVLTMDSYGLADVRRVIDDGHFHGSRLNISFFALCGSGGHADVTQDLRAHPRLADLYESRTPAVGNGAGHFRRMVRKQIKYGADFIKIMATGGLASPIDAPDEMHLAEGELSAIIDTAHDYGKPVTAHAYTPRQVACLAALGVDGIEHGSLLDEPAVAAMERAGIYLVPTMDIYERMLGADPDGMNPYARTKILRHGPQLRRTRDLIRDSRLRLGYGTDFTAGHQPYQCGYEYGAMLRAGISPFCALKAATSVNAEILGRDDIGRIAAGALADITAWRRDVLTDENALLDCAFVMKGGRAYAVESDI